MAKAKGLGKGLGALIGGAGLNTPEAGAVSLPISQIEPGLNQPRKQFDEAALADLADSIREHGVLQPLTVRRLSTGYYQIIAGERRWRASKQAGLNEVPVVIIEADDRKVMELGLIENLQREDLNPVEEANGYQALISDYGLTQEELAKRMGKSRPAIANALRLIALPSVVQDMMVRGELSAGHGRAVLAVTGGQAAQTAFAKLIVKNGLSVRQAESAAKKFVLSHTPSADDSPPQHEPHRIYITAVEKELSQRFGRKVTISNRGRKGRLQLEFYDTDDLNALLDLLETLPRNKEGSIL